MVYPMASKNQFNIILVVVVAVIVLSVVISRDSITGQPISVPICGDNLCSSSSGESCSSCSKDCGQCPQNNIILVGTAPDSNLVYTIKYDQYGSRRWQVYESDIVSNINQYLRTRVATDSKKFIIVGAAGSQWAKIIKYSSDGKKQWLTDTPGYVFVDLGIDSQDNIIVLSDAYRIDKYTSDGVQLWGRKYNPTSLVTAVGVAIDTKNNIIVGGTISSSETRYFYVAKYTSDGVVLWTKIIDSYPKDPIKGAAFAYDVAIDPQDNIIITGSTNPSPNYGGDYLTFKLDPNGNVQWSKLFDYRGYSLTAQGVATDSAGNIIISGVKRQVATSNPIPDQFFTIKYGPSANQIWSKLFSQAPYNAEPISVAVDSLDNPIVTGYIMNNDRSKIHQITIKYDKIGNTKWFRNEGDTNAFKTYGSGVTTD